MKEVDLTKDVPLDVRIKVILDMDEGQSTNERLTNTIIDVVEEWIKDKAKLR